MTEFWGTHILDPECMRACVEDLVAKGSHQTRKDFGHLENSFLNYYCSYRRSISSQILSLWGGL